jgi:hypothetical protein
MAMNRRRSFPMLVILVSVCRDPLRIVFSFLLLSCNEILGVGCWREQTYVKEIRGTSTICGAREGQDLTEIGRLGPQIGRRWS